MSGGGGVESRLGTVILFFFFLLYFLLFMGMGMGMGILCFLGMGMVWGTRRTGCQGGWGGAPV